MVKCLPNVEQMSNKKYDLMLCGGGVIGLSIALQCARKGWSVIVVDAEGVGKGASWAGAGILPAGATYPALDPLEQLRALSHRLHREWSSLLSRETGIDNEYRNCGGVYLARTKAERATLVGNQFWWDEHGVHYERWNASELVRSIPLLESLAVQTPNLQAWYVPEDCSLRNPFHIQALVQGCLKLGVTIVENMRIDGFDCDRDHILGAISGSNRFSADRFCITNGAWASKLLPELGIETGILPVRGQMVLFKLAHKPFSQVVHDGHRYVVPREDGHVLAGSCEEEVGFDSCTTESMLQDLKDWSHGLCSLLAPSKAVRSWAGLRPGSFDTYPYLGTLHPFQNGFLASGHFRHGLHWSTATALLMQQWMAGEPTEIDLKPFCIQRGQTLGDQLTIHTKTQK